MFCLLLVSALQSCYAQDSDNAGLQRGMASSIKGWELRSWLESGKWHFSLLVGTNRLKTDEEIKQSAVESINDIKNMLNQLAPGERVSWGGFTLPFYTEEILNDITSYCKQLGLNLYIGDRLEGPFQQNVNFPKE